MKLSKTNDHMRALFFILCLLCGFSAAALSAPATLAKAASLDVMGSGSTVIGHRQYPVGTPVEVVPMPRGQVRVTVQDGATALLPADSVRYIPTPIPKPTATPPATKSDIMPADAGTADLKTISGQIYKSARVFRVEPDGINYTFAGGMVKIPFTDLPEAIRKQYGYNPEKARKYAEQDAAVQQQLTDSQAAAMQATAQAKDREDALAKLEFYMVAKIRQVTDGGALVDAAVAQEVLRTRRVDTSTKLMRGHTTSTVKETDLVPLKEPVFIYGISKDYVDGDTLSGSAWLVGSYRYNTVAGAAKSVRAYANSKELAIQIIRDTPR